MCGGNSAAVLQWICLGHPNDRVLCVACSLSVLFLCMKHEKTDVYVGVEEFFEFMNTLQVIPSLYLSSHNVIMPRS